jgi:CRP-like cAMP-binding protein
MTIEDDISLFERVPTLNTLGRQALRILAIGAETRYIHGGEVLFNEGDAADGGFVVQEGRFRLSAESRRRRRRSNRRPC